MKLLINGDGAELVLTKEQWERIGSQNGWLKTAGTVVGTMSWNGSQWVVDTPSGPMPVSENNTDTPMVRLDRNISYPVRVAPEPDGTCILMSLKP
jgi:hypothetical protein